MSLELYPDGSGAIIVSWYETVTDDALTDGRMTSSGGQNRTELPFESLEELEGLLRPRYCLDRGS